MCDVCYWRKRAEAAVVRALKLEREAMREPKDDDDEPRIELFARESAPGWACWGNESTKFNQEAA